MRGTESRVLLVTALIGVTVGSALGQGIKPLVLSNNTFPGGTWTNYESPHCKPITVAKLVNSQEQASYYVVLCNTPNSTVEIYSLNVASGPPVLVGEVKVGQDPVSVLWHPDSGNATGKIYSANMIGDSVSLINFGFSGSTPTAKLVRTVNVGDEPMHMAINPVTGTLYVTLNSRHAFAPVHPTTLAPVIYDPHYPLVTQGSYKLGVSSQPVTEYVAVAQPRTIFNKNVGWGVLTYVLGSRGSHTNPAYNQYEASVDLFIKDVAGTAASLGHKGLGTKNFNMALDASTNAAWIVSGDAANFDQKGKSNVAGTSGGFLTTYLHLMTDTLSTTAAIHTLDLNAGTTTSPTLSHCTDVALFESGSTYKVFVTAFNADALGMITGVKSGTAWTASTSWTKSILSLSLGSGTFAGPTSLAVKYADSNAPNDPGDRIYVLNRFAATVDIIDPASFAKVTPVGSFNLRPDYEPAYIKNGRRFLYSVGVGNGFNSCASCHFDGRMDFQSWDLSGSSSDPAATFSLDLTSALAPSIYGTFTDFSFTQPKGEFMTQSLQGLVNFEVDSNASNGANPEKAQQTWFTNAPYHWDMDAPQFGDFNSGGIQNLLGGSGLSDEEMIIFTQFINSLHYPPNQEQPKNRKHSGDIGDVDSWQTGTGSGTLGMRGLKVFHIRPIVEDNPLCAGQGCVQCHQIPEGSNNLATEFLGVFRNSGLGLPSYGVPIETAALRGIVQKESLYFPYAVDNSVRSYPGNFTSPYNSATLYPSSLNALNPTLIGPGGGFIPTGGLFHLGFHETVNDFVTSIFTGPSGPISFEEAEKVIQFVREMDHGTAPMIGSVITIDSTGASVATSYTSPTSGISISIQDMMDQVRAINCGLAVHGTLSGGTASGLWYDPRPGGGLFVDVMTPSTTYPPTGTGHLLSQMMAGDVLVFESVPLGMDRLRALPVNTSPLVLTGSAPANITLQPMVPNTMYEKVPELKANWDPFQTTVAPFTWTATGQSEPWQLKAIRLMQVANGLTRGASLRHEAPRRFRVAGENIRHGAILQLWIPKKTPGATQPPDAEYWHLVELPLYPTSETAEGNRVWETAVELDPFWVNAFALGGPWAPGIDQTTSPDMQTRSEVLGVTESNPTTLVFNKSAWNKYQIRVVNEDNTSSGYVANQAVSIQAPPWSH